LISRVAHGNLPATCWAEDARPAGHGFAKYERTGIEVRAEVNIQVDVTMELGKVGETIIVALETPMLEVQKTAQAINVSGEFMNNLPLSSRRVSGMRKPAAGTE
jgi:hypothetical protein